MTRFIGAVWVTSLGLICFGVLAISESLPGVLIDGDIMVDEHDDPWDRQHGPLVDMSLKRWPTAVVPFDVNGTVYTLYDLYVIQEALKEIQKYTCVKFVQRTDEKDYIYITPLGGCWSYVGRKGFEQVLSLVVPQCINKGTIIHEFLHALGLWHEHSRSDRDEYVDILWNNVVNEASQDHFKYHIGDPDAIDNFQKELYDVLIAEMEEKQANFAKYFPEASNFLDFRYDYQSVMHYDAFAFSKSPMLPTMKPKKPQVRIRDLGRAKKVGTLTETDKRKINSLYECKGY